MKPIALLLVLLSGSALAMKTPQPAECGNSVCDPHVRVVEFQEHQSVLLTGAVGRPMVVTFAPDETIFLVNFETPPNVGGKAQDAPWQVRRITRARANEAASSAARLLSDR